MKPSQPIRRALISVSDKTDLAPFARALSDRGVTIISTGGTAKALLAAGIPVTAVEEVTGFPEMMDGRVKTLHPAIHGGLLALRNNPEHERAMSEHGIEPIDLICINLYPFEQTIQRETTTFDEAIEQIDIGGPSMIRSAAKNHRFVTVVTSAAQYDRVISDMAANDGAVSDELRRELAAAAFSRTAEYDAAISAWMNRRISQPYPSVLRLSLVYRQELRYGENPHQSAALYADPADHQTSVVNALMLHGKPLSYNNLLDASAALDLVHDLHDVASGAAAATIIKHTNPCGAAIGASVVEAFERAYMGDPLAAYGGILAISTAVDRVTAERIAAGEKFFEVIVAPSFADEAQRILSERWKNVRLLATGPLRRTASVPPLVRGITGGMLVQEPDRALARPSDWKCAAGPEPTSAMLADAALAWTVVKHLKSNAVCIAASGRLLGAGAGQMDRVTSSRLAMEKALAGVSAGSSAAKSLPVELGAVAASDAFFPFADGPKLLLDAGVRCLVHPGGSKRDAETLELCSARGVTCLFTDIRHFRH